MALPKHSGKIILALLVAGGAWYLWGNTSSKQSQTQTPPVAINTAQASRQDMPVTLSQVGTVVANQTVAVRARVDSQIMEVKFKDGDVVHQGDVLFVLDNRTWMAQKNQEEAKLVNLRAQYERTRTLISKEYVSQADLDQAKAAYEAQKAIVDGISTQLEYTRVTAPIDGRTGTINVTVGNTVKANDATPLVTINQMKPIRVQLSLPQQYLDTVRDSMTAGAVGVEARKEGGSEVSKGTLEYIDNAVDQSTGTFAARALFDNSDEALWPGMFVTLSLTLGKQENALVVPEVAVQHGQEGDYVFVIEGDKASKREVKIARMQDTMAVIDTGLQEGETVATDGLLSLKDGATVAVNKAEPKPAATPEETAADKP